MQRFMDPEVFPRDVIADYFQSVAPYGYTALYRMMAALGIPPLLFSKLLPVFLILITAGYCYVLCLEILPIPAAGFLATVLLSQSLCLGAHLISGTPRDFASPLLLAFFYYLLRRSLPFCLVTIALQGLFYPSIVSISVGILLLRLFRWEGGRIRLSRDRSDFLFCLSGLVIASVVILPFLLRSSQFGPVFTAAEARHLPEMRPGGRAGFFLRSASEYWLTGRRGGMFPSALTRHKVLFLGLLLPLVLAFPSRFPVLKRVTSGIRLFPQVLLSSLGMFFLAHALLFKLHLPSRYTQHTFRIILSLAAAIALVAMLDVAFRWAGQGSVLFRQVLPLGLVALLGVLLAFYPASMKMFPRTNYVVGKHSALYRFFLNQPKDILIASLSREADNLPTFAQRSVLVSAGTAIPYHKGYYTVMRERISDLMRAQYTCDVRELQGFIRKYGADFWLLDLDAFTPGYLATNRLTKHFPSEAREVQLRLERGELPALSLFANTCTVFRDRKHVVLQAECILKYRPPGQGKAYGRR
ncbi:MAG: hypothetical protein QHH30_02700 [candidate division NC10 bacterium]|nr:hypothetical protein [candidate division NC10 bacterium]